MLGGVGVGAREDSGSEEESEGECKEGESERTKRERRESEGRRELEHARLCYGVRVSPLLPPSPDCVRVSVHHGGRTHHAHGHDPDAVHIGRHALSRRPPVSTQQGTAQE